MAKETTSVLTAVLHGSKAPTPQQLQRFTDFLTAKYHQPVQLTFEQKVDNAYAKGAEAILVYDNVVSESLTDMGGITKTDIGSVFISKADGEKLLSLGDQRVTVGQTQWEDGALTMSDFSSWGVTLDLKLKPEIAAPGGNIYSAVLNNGYANMSGTSMASPHMAGLSALAKQYIMSDSKSWTLLGSSLTGIP